MKMETGKAGFVMRTARPAFRICQRTGGMTIFGVEHKRG